MVLVMRMSEQVGLEKHFEVSMTYFGKYYNIHLGDRWGGGAEETPLKSQHSQSLSQNWDPKHAD